MKYIYKGIIEKYREYLPVSDKTPVVSLLEGNTPLIPSKYIHKLIGKNVDVFLKYEGLNPSGSFKDRGMTVAVSKAVEEGSHAIICASTGNTSASAAAYAAAAGLRCAVLIPKGAIALGKLAQALIHGAKVIAIDGNFDDALILVKDISANYPITLVNSINPYRIEGQKTGAYEICDTLGCAPMYHAIPVGNAGNITAYWKGYNDYKKSGKTNKLPKMLGFEAAGAAPIVKGSPVKKPDTIATAIRIGNPASWHKAVEARDESGGLISSVTDKEIVTAYRLLAQKEGIFVEPASAASVAGIIKLAKKGYFAIRPPVREAGNMRACRRDSQYARRITIVCTLTGHGLKDPERAIKTIKMPRIVSAKLKPILREIGF